jgi:transaldolase
MEQARGAGRDLREIRSVASLFVSRVDTEIDSRLDKIGTAEALAMRGRAAIANTRLVYKHYERAFASPRWTALRDAGASPQRPLWASTSVKNPAYPDTRYVTELVAPGVVNTMPEATLRAVADHGHVPADSIRDHYDEARQVIDTLQHLGIDFGDVMQVLEDDGVTKFDQAWQELGEKLATALRNRSTGQTRS